MSQFLACLFVLPQCSASEETCLFFLAIDHRVAVGVNLYVLRSQNIELLSCEAR
jgi:hypothetical protein